MDPPAHDPDPPNEDPYEPLRRQYSELATRYDTRWRFYVEASVQETLWRLEVAPGDRILDVGCGTGALLEGLTLASPGMGLAGVDLSPEMLEVARRRLGPAVVLREARAEALPFGNATFDTVVSTNVFHFIRRPGAALREMRRVLKPSGRIVITDWCHDYLTCRVCDLFLRTFGRGHHRTYRSEELRQLLVEADFRDVEVDRYRISWLWGLMTATAGKGS